MITIIALTAAVLLIIADQLIKLWAGGALALEGSIQVIPGFFHLTYVENRGAAFGILQGKTGLLAVIVSLVVIAALYLIISGKIKSSFLVWAVSLVISGGIGNLIDRIRLGFVVDYLDFSALFGFPVFNLADCCVVVGTILILIYVLFLERAKKSDESAAENCGNKV